MIGGVRQYGYIMYSVKDPAYNTRICSPSVNMYSHALPCISEKTHTNTSYGTDSLNDGNRKVYFSYANIRKIKFK